MRPLILLTLTLLLMCACESKDEARQVLDDARRLARQGDYEAALAKHVWFHDHALETQPSYYGVRLSFALSDWAELGSKYPPALEKLKSVRDVKTARLRGGETNRELFHDVEAINTYLGDTAATVDLFRKIDTDSPAFAATIYDLADESLVEAREYVLARKYLGDPAKRLAAHQDRYQEGLEYASSKDARQASAARQAHESIFTEDVVRLLLVLSETGDKETAKNLQAQALKTLDSEKIRNALPPQ